MPARVTSRRRGALSIAAAVAIVSIVAGCGGSSGSSATTPATHGTSSSQSQTTAGATVLNIQASASELAFVPNALSAPAGRITIRMTNPSQLQHSIALAVSGIAPGPVVGHGGVSQVVANLQPGTYTFYCTVPGHRQAGMTGTLTVN